MAIGSAIDALAGSAFIRMEIEGSECDLHATSYAYACLDWRLHSLYTNEQSYANNDGRSRGIGFERKTCDKFRRDSGNSAVRLRPLRPPPGTLCGRNKLKTADSMKNLIAVVAILLMIPFASAEPSCESRLNGSPVQIIFEKGLEHGATSLAVLAEFATSPKWYNPFVSARATLAGPKFISAFDQITRQMSAEERAQVKLTLQEFLVKQNALNAIVHENSKATENILTAFWLPPLDMGGMIPANDHMGIVTLNQRPVLLKRIQRGEKKMLALLDPFNPNPTGRVKTITEAEHSHNFDRPIAFTANGEVYAFYPKNFRFYNLSSGGAGFGNPILLNNRQIVRTPEGPAVIGESPPLKTMVFDERGGPLFPPEFHVDLNDMVSFSSVGDRDIVTAAGSKELFFLDMSGKEHFHPYRFGINSKLTPILAPIVFEDGGDLLAAQPLKREPDEYFIEVIDIRKNILIKKIALPGTFMTTTKLVAIKFSGHTKLVFETFGKDEAATVHTVLPRTGVFQSGQPIRGEWRKSLVDDYGFHVFEALGRTLLISGGFGKIHIFDPSNGAFETFPLGEERIFIWRVLPFTYQGVSYAFVDAAGSNTPRLIQLTINKP